MGQSNFDYSPATVQGAFARLARLLAKCPLPAVDFGGVHPATGGRCWLTSPERTATVDEFMFMGGSSDGYVGRLDFKHCLSRNYVRVVFDLPHWGRMERLDIPRTCEPFRRGGFPGWYGMAPPTHQLCAVDGARD